MHSFDKVHAGSNSRKLLVLLFALGVIRSVAISNDGKFIVSASEDKSIKIFDIQAKDQVHHFVDIHDRTSFYPFLI